MHPILNGQNEPQRIKLLEASTVAYTRAKAWEVFITYFLLFLAIAYPLTYIFLKNDQVKFTLFGCSFLLTVAIQIFMDHFKGNTSKGAIYKEEFDVDLFKLPWKSTLSKPNIRDVEKLAAAYSGNPIKDWYAPILSERLPDSIAIATLQHSNTNWDIVLRKNYRKLLVGFLIVYSVILIIVLILKRVDFLTTFLLLFSTLSFYTHFISLIRAHTGVIKKRQAIAAQLDEWLRKKVDIPMQVLRDVQDEIFLTRQEATKVPNFFFRWFQQKMNQEANKYIEEINKLYV